VPDETVDTTARELAEDPSRGTDVEPRTGQASLPAITGQRHEHRFAEEAAATALLSQTHDRVEGVAALLEGGRPTFTGT